MNVPVFMDVHYTEDDLPCNIGCLNFFEGAPILFYIFIEFFTVLDKFCNDVGILFGLYCLFVLDEERVVEFLHYFNLMMDHFQLRLF